jgi:hypothetical protein
VAREGDSLRVAWDRAAQGIANAQRAVLWIRDGDGQDKIDLDPDRLRAGSIAYRPKNGDVTFRMEVYTASASSGELVRSAGALYASPAAPSVPAPGMSGEADRAELAELAETAAPFTPVPLARHAARRPRRGSAQRVAEPRASTYGRLADARPAMSLLPEPPKIDAPPAAAPDVPLGGEYADPFCRVTVVPASHSRLARVFGKLRGRSGVALPSPVRDPAPAVPLDVRQRISGEVEIDVRVLVGPTGAVRDAELLSKGKDAALADLALFASRRSEFTSPREAGLDVPAELVLRYRFGSRNQ